MTRHRHGNDECLASTDLGADLTTGAPAPTRRSGAGLDNARAERRCATLPAGRVRGLGELAFLPSATNVPLVGPPGVGKTHWALTWALKARRARKRVPSARAPAPLDSLVAARVAGTLGRPLQQPRGPGLRAIDRLGHTPMAPQRATRCFQRVSQRYAHSAIVVTGDVPLDRWGRSFGDDAVIAAAILDRLLHYSEAFAIAGPSYRLRGQLPR